MTKTAARVAPTWMRHIHRPPAFMYLTFFCSLVFMSTAQISLVTSHSCRQYICMMINNIQMCLQAGLVMSTASAWSPRTPEKPFRMRARVWTVQQSRRKKRLQESESDPSVTAINRLPECDPPPRPCGPCGRAALTIACFIINDKTTLTPTTPIQTAARRRRTATSAWTCSADHCLHRFR